MKTHIKQWGNSLAIRLPKTATDILHLKDGSEVELTITDDAILIAPATSIESLDTLLAQVTPSNLHHTNFSRTAGPKAH